MPNQARSMSDQIKQSLPLADTLGAETAFALQYSLHRTTGTAWSVSRAKTASALKCVPGWSHGGYDV